MKNALIGVSVVAALLLLGMTYVGARSIDRARIAALEQELVHVRSTRDSIQTVVAYKDSVQGLLRQQIRLKTEEADQLRRDRQALEQERQRQELEVRRLDSLEAVEQKFLDTFPELGRSTQVAEVNRDGFPFTYIMMPLTAVETFVLDNQDRLSYQAQRDLLLDLDSLQTTVIALKDSVLALEEEKAAAYKRGYDEAYAQYEALNQEYIGVLKQPPQVSLFPNNRTAVISGTAGAVLGVFVGAAASRVGND